MERRLAAILAADAVGYSRLMGRDEEGTLAALTALRSGVVDPTIAAHRGRVVKATGDGFLAEFTSVAEAVRCALAIQSAVSNASTAPQPLPIRFRMAVNVGDVIHQDDDIFGDGVNIAARLEALAEPGGIVVSRAVRDQLGDKLPVGFADLGHRSLKNIAHPVQCYRITSPGGVDPSWRTWIAAGIGMLAAVLAAAFMLGWPPSAGLAPGTRPGSAAAPARAPEAPRVEPGRLSIAVLPFSSMTADSADDPFTDGITEDLITDLSRISGAFVIARNTMFTFKGKAVSVKEVGRELGVDYVLEGSVRRDRNRVRVNAQLIDAGTGAHIWADRFDREIADLFQLQSEITGRIARALHIELIEAESRKAERKLDNPDAYDLAMRAWSVLYNRPQSPETNSEAERLIDAALRLDPNEPRAWVARAYALTRAGVFGWSETPADALRLAAEAGERATRLDPKSADAHYQLGFALRSSGRLDESIAAMERALALNPNYAFAYHGLAYGKVLTGKPAEALPLMAIAFKLSPRDAIHAVWHGLVALAEALNANDEAAVAAARKGIAANPRYRTSYFLLASGLAHQGQFDAAREALAQFLSLERRARTIALLRDSYHAFSDNAAFRRQLERVLNGLRLAGMPE